MKYRKKKTWAVGEKKQNSFGDLWDNIKWSSIHVI